MRQLIHAASHGDLVQIMDHQFSSAAESQGLVMISLSRERTRLKRTRRSSVHVNILCSGEIKEEKTLQVTRNSDGSSRSVRELK